MKGFCAGQDTSRLLRYIQALRSDPGNSLKKPGVQVQGQQVHGCHCFLKRGRRSAAGLGSHAHLTYSPSTRGNLAALEARDAAERATLPGFCNHSITVTMEEAML